MGSLKLHFYLQIYQTDYLCAECMKSLKLVAKFHDKCMESKAILQRKQPIPLLGEFVKAKIKINKTDSNQSNKSDPKDDNSPFKWPSTSPKASTSNKDDENKGAKFFSPIKEDSTDVASIDSDW